ncbi:NF-kappa-B inhibitor delta-like [Hemitrygon akajei]|uniref:NF-kappa-B inhibitor delta-like n=1 Tax=Hemitrygon akajei TaxID=2704970 RepID=UPI003BF95C7B
MHWQKSPKERSQSNLLPTVRELLEAKRRNSNGGNPMAPSKALAQQQDGFGFPNPGGNLGPVFPAYPSWHVDVAQSTLSHENSACVMPEEVLPREGPNSVGVYDPYVFTAPSSDTIAAYPDQPAPYTPLIPGPNLLPLEPPCPVLPQWAGSGACAQQDDPPPVPYLPPSGLTAGHSTFPSQPLGGPQLEEARRTVQRMQVSELLQPDHDGDTVLHIYAAKGMREFAFATAERIYGLKGLEVREHKGKTPLLVAVTANQPQIVYDLIELGADVRATDLKGQTILHLAATEGYPQILQAVQWTRVQVNIEARNYEGFTPLHCAVKAHSCSSIRKEWDIRRFGRETCRGLQNLAQDILQCIIHLLNMGASIFSQDVKSSMSILHQAVQDGNVSLVQFILQLPNPRLQEFVNLKAHGNTALHMAAGLHGDRNQEQIIRLLLDCGADPGIRNLENEQAGHLLPNSPHGEQMKHLLKRGRLALSNNHRAASS